MNDRGFAGVVGKIGMRLLPPGFNVTRQLHGCTYAREIQSGLLGWAEGGVKSGDEAEKLVDGARERRLRGDGPVSSGELPHPIAIEIATAYVYTAMVIR
jgi:hypothetical protein